MRQMAPIDSLIADKQQREGVRMARYGIAILILFCVALFQSCEEVRLSMWGVTSTATVGRVEPSTVDRKKFFVSLTFPDADGVPRVVRTTLAPPEDGAWQAGQQVEVIYLRGGHQWAKPVSERSMFWPLVLVGMILAALAYGWRAWRLAEQGRL